jgi:hypothetical protein
MSEQMAEYNLYDIGVVNGRIKAITVQKYLQNKFDGKTFNLEIVGQNIYKIKCTCELLTVAEIKEIHGLLEAFSEGWNRKVCS